MRYFIIFYTLFFIGFLNAQSEWQLDSLQKVLETTKDKYEEIDLLNELAYLLKDKNRTKAKGLANSALQKAKKLKYKKGEASSLIRLGLICNKEGDVNKAKQLYKEAIFIREKIGNNEDIAKAYINLGRVYHTQEKIDSAKINYHSALNLLEDDSVPETKVKVLIAYAELCRMEGELTEATEYLEKANRIIDNLKDDISRANLLINLGNIYLELDNWQKVEEAYKKSLKIFESENNETGQGKCYINLGAYHIVYGEYPEALEALKRASDFKSFLSKNDFASINQNLILIYNALSSDVDLEQAYLKSIEIYKKLENQRKLAAVNFNMGEIKFNSNHYSEALDFFKLSQKYIDIDNQPLLASQLFSYLANTYRKLRNIKLADKYTQLYIPLKDSLNSSYIKAINYQRNQEENQKKIAQLQADSAQLQATATKLKLQSSEAKRQNQFYMGLGLISFIALLAGIAAFVAYRNRQQQLIAEFKTEKAYAEIDDLLVEQELKMANAKLIGKDEEQHRIAKDLHDRLGMMLSTIKLYFNDIDSQLKEMKTETVQQHQKANDLLDEVCTEVRLIAHNMASGTLSKFGLINGLKELVNTINGSNQIDARLYTHGLKERLDEKTEAKIYKIILELVGNVLKHAQAQKLNIQLNQIGEELNIVVEDNGKGFQPEQAEKKDGMGLRNITLRVADLNGKFHIDSGKGSGTTIAIDIPIKTKANTGE